MKYFIIIFSCFLFIAKVKSQNLVPNPSFEIYEICPKNYTVESVKDFIPNWVLPTKGTSDYFNSCSRFQVNVPNNFIGHMYAKDGQAYAGIILIEKPSQDPIKTKEKDYREYLQTELNESLIKGKSYEVKFYYSIATYSTFAANNLGAYLSAEKIKKRRSRKTLSYSPQIKADTCQINTIKDIWFEVCDTIIAQGEEQYLTIGNFYSDTETKYFYLDTSGIRQSLLDVIKRNLIAYYYIDMVSVKLIKD
jgi:hypothetical protein